MKEYLKSKRSFTLIELLVVIAIIGLLSSVVLVNLSGPRQKAKITKALEFSQSVQHAIGVEAVGIWDFDDCSAKDLSGYKNNGTINGAVCVDDTPYKVVGSGQGKNALSFDGNDDYVDCGNGVILDITNEITISMWVKLKTISGSRQVFLDKGSFTDDKSYYFGWDGSQVEMRIWYTNGLAVKTYAPSVDKWYYFVATGKNGEQKFYVNGELIGSTSIIGTITSTSRPVLLGNANGRSYYFNGIIDEVRIYSTALSVYQIKEHYLAGLEKHQQLTIK